jgi:hypothetical protein
VINGVIANQLSESAMETTIIANAEVAVATGQSSETLNKAFVEAVRELSALELALVGGGSTSAAYM